MIPNEKMRGLEVGDGIKCWGPEYKAQTDSWVYAFKKAGPRSRVVYLEMPNYGAKPLNANALHDLLPKAREAFNGPGN